MHHRQQLQHQQLQHQQLQHPQFQKQTGFQALSLKQPEASETRVEHNIIWGQSQDDHQHKKENKNRWGRRRGGEGGGGGGGEGGGGGGGGGGGRRGLGGGGMLEDEEGEEEEEEENIIWGQPHSHSAYFDDATPTNVTAVVGQRATLVCKVNNLGGKVVSWIRKRDLHIITAGTDTFSSDDRFRAYHPADKDWMLEISSVTFRDAGVYECQISTSPKISLPVYLSVEVQQARIQGSSEVHIQNGSTISLTCVINTHADNVGSVTWYRDTSPLDYNSPRGGVSLETEKTPTRTTSKLFITRAMKSDSGNYTCAPRFADAAAVMVHVVNGEESAAVQTGTSTKLMSDEDLLLGVLLLPALLQQLLR
ncbi:uncharacterized protein LOC143034236 [Oratosquilla oratoria]|uniref:uncharacterized protein LOC143034236 n=1 Tax=Oratosquilla oratoria TaxID=337810 RepID=UPI003F7781EF